MEIKAVQCLPVMVSTGLHSVSCNSVSALPVNKYSLHGRVTMTE